MAEIMARARSDAEADPALVMMKIAQTHALKQIPSEPDLAFCFTMLQRVSRSFAFIIQQLGPDLRNVVCIFYLVLRGLDTIEDDTSDHNKKWRVRV